MGIIADLSKRGNLGQIRTNQREIVLVVQLPDSAYFVQRLLVADVAGQRVRRIGWISNNPALLDNLHGTVD